MDDPLTAWGRAAERSSAIRRDLPIASQLTLGQDFSGVIEKIGPGSNTSFREGDEVFGETWGSFNEIGVLPRPGTIWKARSPRERW